MRARGDLPYEGEPWMWIAKDGKPAAILGDPAQGSGLDGLPSSEAEDGFQVYELLLIMHQGVEANVLMFPLFYGDMVRLAAGGLVPQHHEPTQEWKYRPCMYRWNTVETGSWERQGSQRELSWRHNLHQTLKLAGIMEDAETVEDGKDQATVQFWIDRMRYDLANTRADALLDSMLGPTQLYELRMENGFRVIGGATGKWYRIVPGDGFFECGPMTNANLKSYCLHPEDWMPDSDVALSLKLHLEDPDLEEETVAAANCRERKPVRVPEPEAKQLRYVLDMERELMPA